MIFIWIWVLLSHINVESSPSFLKVVTLVVERELITSPRASVGADASSRASNHSNSPATNRQKVNSRSSTRTPQNSKLKDYNFVTAGRWESSALVWTYGF